MRELEKIIGKNINELLVDEIKNASGEHKWDEEYIMEVIKKKHDRPVMDIIIADCFEEDLQYSILINMCDMI